MKGILGLVLALGLVPPVCVTAQTPFPWERPAVPSMAAKPVGGVRVAHVGLKFWKATPIDPDWRERVRGLAQVCLEQASLAHGLKVVLEDRGSVVVPEEDIDRFLQRRTYVTASGLPRGPYRSSESPHLNIFVRPRIESAMGALLGVTEAIEAHRGENGDVLSFRGARDLQLSAGADGEVLAHEILHAWGGLVDRHADPTNLMDDRTMGCVLTEEQAGTVVRHSYGGASELAR